MEAEPTRNLCHLINALTKRHCRTVVFSLCRGSKVHQMARLSMLFTFCIAISSGFAHAEPQINSISDEQNIAVTLVTLLGSGNIPNMFSSPDSESDFLLVDLASCRTGCANRYYGRVARCRAMFDKRAAAVCYGVAATAYGVCRARCN